jgi:hypothetical protein
MRRSKRVKRTMQELQDVADRLWDAKPPGVYAADWWYTVLQVHSDDAEAWLEELRYSGHELGRQRAMKGAFVAAMRLMTVTSVVAQYYCDELDPVQRQVIPLEISPLPVQRVIDILIKRGLMAKPDGNDHPDRGSGADA